MSKRVAPLLFLVALAITGCSSNSGLPGQPGTYDVRSGSVRFDGERYQFLWTDAASQIHKADGKDFRLAQSDRNSLQIGDGSPVLNLKEDEKIAVQGEDRNGGYSSFWFPFLLGQALGGGGGFGLPHATPTYRYPPTDTFGRDETMHGTVTSDRPVPPDYSQVKPAANSVSGQAAGTGGGTAATNKSTSPVSGQAGGVGSGSAASTKGGFASGPSSYASKGASIGSGSKISSGGLFGASAGKAPSRALGGRSSGGVRLGRR
ncbi:MAG: hypothetical protein EXR58_03545 [Chloroflexi bacterium]|nr:hypothetical protein [Chloroflexota bacterium]